MKCRLTLFLQKCLKNTAFVFLLCMMGSLGPATKKAWPYETNVHTKILCDMNIFNINVSLELWAWDKC